MPVAGFGIDKNNFVGFLGANWTIAQNIGLNVGLALNEQKCLKGHYEENEVLAVKQESDDLVEEVYRPSLFLGLTFRF